VQVLDNPEALLPGQRALLEPASPDADQADSEAAA